MSSTERFEQGVLGISMAISMSIPAILDFTKLLKTAKTSILEYIAVKNLLSAAEIKTLAEEGKLTLAEIARIITQKQLSKASTEVAGATALEGASAGAAVTPTMLLGTALKGLAVSAVPFLAIAAPLVALIAGIGYAIKTNIDNVYAYDNALDQASDTAAQSTQAYEAQKSKLEELNSAIETINGQEDAFEGLTKGTQE